MRSPSFIGTIDMVRQKSTTASSASSGWSASSGGTLSRSSSHNHSRQSIASIDSDDDGSVNGDALSLDADRSLVPLLLDVNPEIDSIVVWKRAQRKPRLILSQHAGTCIGRDFNFKLLGPGLFARLIVRLISYTRQHNKKHKGTPWLVLYGRGQIYLSHSGTAAKATECATQNKIQVRTWGMVLLLVQNST